MKTIQSLYVAKPNPLQTLKYLIAYMLQTILYMIVYMLQTLHYMILYMLQTLHYMIVYMLQTLHYMILYMLQTLHVMILYMLQTLHVMIVYMLQTLHYIKQYTCVSKSYKLYMFTDFLYQVKWSSDRTDITKQALGQNRKLQQHGQRSIFNHGNWTGRCCPAVQYLGGGQKLTCRSRGHEVGL